MNFLSKTYQRIRSESSVHLDETRHTYCSHLTKSVKTSFNLLCAATAVLIHGAVPVWCKQVGHQMILREADNIDHPQPKVAVPEYTKSE